MLTARTDVQTDQCLYWMLSLFDILCHEAATIALIKETKSATMNIFRFFFIFVLDHL